MTPGQPQMDREEVAWGGINRPLSLSCSHVEEATENTHGATPAAWKEAKKKIQFTACVNRAPESRPFADA